MAGLKADLDQLLLFPLSGPSREYLATNLRVKFHRAYAVYYTPTEQDLIVIRVLHGARDAAAIADRGGFDG